MGLKLPRKKKEVFFADFALQIMVETTLPDKLVFAFWMIFSVFQKNQGLGYSWSTRKPRFPVEGHIANFGIFLEVFEFLRFGLFFLFFKKFRFWGILGPPYCGIGATICIGREMLCFPYEFFFINSKFYRTTGNVSKAATRV